MCLGCFEAHGWARYLCVCVCVERYVTRSGAAPVPTSRTRRHFNQQQRRTAFNRLNVPFLQSEQSLTTVHGQGGKSNLFHYSKFALTLCQIEVKSAGFTRGLGSISATSCYLPLLLLNSFARVWTPGTNLKQFD